MALSSSLTGVSFVTNPIVLGGAFLLVSLLVFQNLFSAKYPPNLPLVRERPGKRYFSLTTRLAFHINAADLFREAYEKFGRIGRTVVIPGLGTNDEIIIPNSSMRWLLAQPENVLSATQASADVDQIHYSLGHEKYIADSWPGLLVKKEMNLVLETLCSALQDELSVAFDEYFGTDTDEWREIDLQETLKMVVAQAASRFTVGLPLCRNKAYLETSLTVIDRMLLTAGGAGVLPSFLRPVLGHVIAIPSRLVTRRFHKFIQPEFERRMQLLKEIEKNPELEPLDHMQMMIRYAQANRPDELNGYEFAKRLAVTNFGSMHQTLLATTNMILNIIASNPEHDTIAVLRNEAVQIIGTGKQDQAWTRANVARMTKADSVARETMRLNTFPNRAMMRKVLVNGLKTEDGVELPKGSRLSILSYPIHSNEEFFEAASKFDPFRYARVRESSDNKGGNLSFVTTGPHFLPFGHGKHACPGRFLVDFELKMIISYLLMNYDIEFPAEYKGQRPPTRWVTEATFPPAGARIRVKRRKPE